LYLYIETLKQRLDAINQLRVDRALAAMGPAFQHVYSLLPTLLHYHHPLMPGYFDGNVPRGISFFTPEENQLLLMRELAGSRELTLDVSRTGEMPITGIYSMGSTSSVGQNSVSDLISGSAISHGWITKSASTCSANARCCRSGAYRWAWKSASS